MSPLLSICIPTLNRGKFLPQTLDSILNQNCDEIEIVVVDGGSRDDTENIVRGYANQYSFIKYILSPDAASTNVPSNEGFDRDCDFAVRSANGLYCWLMSDDDVLTPNSIQRVLSHCSENHDVIVVSNVVKDIQLKKTIRMPSLVSNEDRVFTPSQWNEFFVDTSHLTGFLGSIVIRRAVWVTQNTKQFYGTGFIHMGVIFNKPLTSSNLFIREALVVIRYSNALWTHRAFQITMINWPQVIWSFTGIEAESKAKVIDVQPWRRIKHLVRLRAMNAYSLSVYKQHLGNTAMSKLNELILIVVAMMPRWIARAAVYLVAWKKSIFNADSLLLQDLLDSR